jgi:F-type H+-transporting ATPase subunit delta
MSDAITIARPYAQAAFDEAQKLNSLKAWSEMLTGLAEFASQAEVNSVIGNPRVSKAQLFWLMEASMGEAAKIQLLNFVHVLAENRRLSVLPEIAATFEALKAEAEKSVNVVVDSAFELTAVQQEKIIVAMNKRMGREIKLTCNVKKDLLGGVVIRAGDKVIDGSARTRLGEMAVALA